jgi:outer membrane receptor protein involved in Fe transport
MNDEKIENTLGRRLQHVMPILIAMTASLTTTPALAQSTTAATATPADSSESGLAEVLVTASKKGAQNIQDVALNISAVGSDQLAKSGAATLDEVMAAVPGVEINGPSGNKTIVIRGLAAQTGTALVGLYLDEILLPSASAPGVNQSDLPLFDIERVEVLRGPQGTLYGAGSMGGTVRYITTPPDLEHSSVKTNLEGAEVASSGGGKYQGAVTANVPIVNDLLAMRVTAWERKADGYITLTDINSKGVNWEDSNGARVELLYQPLDTTKITATVNYQNVKLNDSGYVFTNCNCRANPVLEPYFDRLLASNLTVEQDVGVGKITFTGSNIRRNSEFNYDQSQYLPVGAANAAVFLPTRYNSYDLRYGTIQRLATVNQDTGELRYVSDFKGPLQLTGGLFYDKSTNYGDIYGWYIDPGTAMPYGGEIPPWYKTLAESTNTNKAAFIDATYDLTSQLSIEAGTRYYNLQQTNTIYIANPYFGTQTGYQPYQQAKSTGTVSKGQITYKPMERMLTYLVYSQGFREGGANTQFPGTTGIPASYRPDTVTNYEIGVKTELADRQLTLDGAVYHMIWNGIQVADHDSTGAYTYTTNGSKANFNGVEGEIQISPKVLPDFSAGLTARYSKQVLSENNPTVTTFAGTKGEAIPYSNKVGASVWVEQHFNVWGAPSYAHMDAAYTGRGYTAFDTKDPTYRPIGNYTILNGRLGVKESSWDAALYVKNMANKRGYTTWRVQSTAGIPDEVIITPPREIGLDVNYNFQ